MVNAKLTALSDSGIDISGLQQIEFRFLIASKVSLEALYKQLSVNDGSSILSQGKYKGGGYWLNLRQSIYCNPNHIGEWIKSYTLMGDEYNSVLENWRVVISI